MMLKGTHLIAGRWVGGDTTFTNEPVTGEADVFSAGTVDLVNKACTAAAEAFAPYAATSRFERAAFLRTIADEIDARGDEITGMGCKETGLPEARLIGERGRTTGQLRLFAEHIEAGDYLDRRFDAALPDRAPLPRPDLRLMQRPIGPVAVFGASNFPLAFSTAGGDTAAALAAGCPVVVKGHSAHPGTSDLVAQAIDAAVQQHGLPAGVFSQIQGGNRAVGQAVVQHPAIKAVGFTGSLAGGRALFDLCAARPEPIPFFGELGSVNPMFVLPEALTTRGREIAAGWAASLTMGAGQFCTNPGIAILVEGPEVEAFSAAASEALGGIDTQVMLTQGIADAYHKGCDRIAATPGVQTILANSCTQRNAAPYLFATTGDEWLSNEALSEEVFGPLGMIVIAKDFAQVMNIATSLHGQLTATLHLDEASQTDIEAGKALLNVLEHKAGRILANGFPTGVEVADTMVHGGPYPASTNFGATSVGTMAIRRFLRPVSYQNIPQALLHEDLTT